MVITGLTRNQLGSNPPRVRISPSPPVLARTAQFPRPQLGGGFFVLIGSGSGMVLNYLFLYVIDPVLFVHLFLSALT